MWYKLKRILIYPDGVTEKQVYPAVLEYDFTTWTHWWTPDTSAWLQNSNWIYTNWLVTNVFWSAPSEIFRWTPKRIIINYNKTGTDNWTWIYSANPMAWYYLPRWKRYDNLQNRFDWNVNWTITQNTINNPTWLCTWELDIDTSTSNWTITHKITWVSNITEQSWAFKTIWNSWSLNLRTVNWDSWNPWIYIRSILFEY